MSLTHWQTSASSPSSVSHSLYRASFHVRCDTELPHHLQHNEVPFIWVIVFHSISSAAHNSDSVQRCTSRWSRFLPTLHDPSSSCKSTHLRPSPPSFLFLALTTRPHTVPQHFIPIAEDVVAVLGHPAVHTPSHSDITKQSEHSPTAPDSRHVSRGNSSGCCLPSPPANIVVSELQSPEPSTFFWGGGAGKYFCPLSKVSISSQTRVITAPSSDYFYPALIYAQCPDQ